MSAIDTSLNWSDTEFNEDELQQLLNTPTGTSGNNNLSLSASTECCGFDNSCGDTWIYPTNLPQRAYQYSITQAALYRNTLVVLPTGLGKTFIAAVVMYNLARWYPTGKLIFMAPTRPLVAQQIAACQKIMPLPAKDIVELTGKLPKAKRAELWRTKRVFFATPQVVQSDIISDVSGTGDIIFPFKDIKLLVFDEAHKAKGRYAYTEVAQHILARNRYFRVLALSATPGRTMDDVAEVCRNLYISHLEVRWDTSIDVLPYVHQRSMKTIVVPLGAEIQALRARLLEIIDPYMRQLVAADVLRGSVTQINRNFLLFEQRRFRERSMHERIRDQATINSNFSFCISLYHALELLERHGLRVFINHFEVDEDGRNKFVLTMDAKLRDLIEKTKNKLGANPFNISTTAMTNGELIPMPNDLDFGHPKYEQARQCLLQHFETHSDSRAIVFCEYRESVMLIYRLLRQHVPLLRPRCFVGQGGVGAIRSITQKQQIQIMQDFRSGKSNILVATSIGEEGIDVGEVELIVCFDISTSNPTRFIQRIGRTGRKKSGNVIMLVTEGREQQLMKEVLANREQTNKKLLRSTVVKEALYQHAPRLVPNGISPKCAMTLMEAPNVEEAPTVETPKPKAKKTHKQTRQETAMRGSQDLRKFFNKAKVTTASTSIPDLDAEEREIFDTSTDTGAALVATTSLGTQTQQQLKQRTSLLSNLFDTQPAAGEADAKLVPKPTAAHLRRINKLLQTQKPLLTEAQRKYDLQSQLKCKQLSKHAKRLLLQQQPAFVRTLLTQMDVLQTLEAGDDANRMCAEEQEIRNTYKLLVELYGDDVTLRQAYSVPSCEAAECEDSLTQFEAMQAVEIYDNACTEVFAGLAESTDYCCDNFEFIQEQLAAVEQQKAEITQLEQSELCNHNAESMVYDNLVAITDTAEDLDANEISNYTLTDSKYQDQWLDLCQDNDESKDETSVVEVSESAAHVTHLLPCQKLSHASTPLASSKIKAKQPNLVKELEHNVQDNELEAFMRDFEAVDLPIAAEQQPQKKHDIVDMQKELELDLADFLEPLPEEQQLLQATQTPTPSPTAYKENKNNCNKNDLLPVPLPKLHKLAPRNSPDLFNETITPIKSALPSLATKLAAKCSAMQQSVQPSSSSLASPKQAAKIDASKQDKSPSVFDLYLKNTRGRIKLPQAVAELSVSSIKDSPILRKRSSAKRKIISSDTEEEQEEQQQQNMIDLNDDDSDFEQVPSTQMPCKTYTKQNFKRRKLNSFIDGEAALSGASDDSEDAEETIGAYMKDSVIVSSDEHDEDNDAVQVMYLQALRSPQNRPGAFKIPAQRVYNDASQIFSQTVLPQDMEPSQYLPNSFIVSGDEDDAGCDASRDVTMSPLERAERILKARRKAKRRAKLDEPAKKQPRKRRVQCFAESSSDDEDDNDDDDGVFELV